jgi:hypothetical protein
MAAPTTTRPVRDRFDTIPDDLHRVGAHRTKAHPARGLITLAWVVGAIAVLSVAGLWGLSQIYVVFEFGLPAFTASDEEPPADLPEDEAPVEAEPVLDPKIAVTVLNGTETSGMANTVGDYLVKQGWGGAELGIGARANASANDVETTLVIYNDPANEGAARAMVETLGVGEIRLANTYPASPIAVLVGSDFSLPAE